MAHARVMCIKSFQGDNVDIGGSRELLTFSTPSSPGFQEELGGPDFSESTYGALKDDIVAMFTNSKEQWPADFGTWDVCTHVLRGATGVARYYIEIMGSFTFGARASRP